MRIPFSTFVLLGFGLVGGTTPHLAASPPPDVIYVNANIHTLAEPPRAEALATAGERIAAIGARSDVLRLRRPHTRIVDLDGKTVLPGLIDAHGHFAALGGYGLGQIDLGFARSYDEVIATITERVKESKPGEWIVGGRWDHESWPERRLPTHERLSAISPENPVWLTRVDGHAGLANAAAMKIAGVTRESSSPVGGEILKNAAGEPTGVFIDNAEELIAKHIPGSRHSTADLLLKAQEMCLSVGLTGIHDAGVTPADLEAYRELVADGKLRIRVYAMVAGEYAIAYFKERGVEIGDHLTVRAAKLYADGALGSRGAWLLEPYSDRPTDADGLPYVGLNLMKSEFLRLVAEDGLRQGYQVCTHAIGDRGNRAALDAYALALSRRPTDNHRYRIEHAQILALEDVPRFKQLAVIPSMQPTHCTSDMRWVYDRVGRARARGAYAWASLRKTGVPIPGGSDFPIESHNPFLGLYAAVTRRNLDGLPPGGWQPDECMTRAEALRSFTYDAAYAAFEEDLKGTLEPGKLADFIVIDRDVLTCPEREMADVRVLRTVIGGETVYQAP